MEKCEICGFEAPKAAFGDICPRPGRSQPCEAYRPSAEEVEEVEEESKFEG